MPAEGAPSAGLAQTAVNASAELVASLGLRTADELNECFTKVFNHVFSSLVAAAKEPIERKSKGGRAIPVISQDEMQKRLQGMIQSPPTLNQF